MKRMVRLPSKKSHSWWWNSHISPKNSKWLAENLEEMDRCVKEMLKLIEEEGDSFAKKAEMYYQKRPELISHVEDFYRMYRALAERYDNVTGELRRNIPSELQSQGSSSGSDLSSEPPSPSLLHSPELTPERKPPRPKPSPRAAGFDFFLGSGGSSDLSRKGSDGSSSSDSDSDSDDSKDVNGDDISGLQVELENELHEHEKGSNGRCTHLENGDHVECSSRISALENKLIAADEKLRIAEAEISSLNQKLAEKNASPESGDSEPSSVTKQVPELEELIAVLQAEISHYKQEIEYLKGAMAAATTRFDHEIDDCNTELADISKTFSQEKTRLEAEVTNLEGAIEEVKSDIVKISAEKSMFEVKIMEQDHKFWELEANAASSAARFLHEKSALEAQLSGLSLSHASLEAKLISLEDEVKRAETEKTGLSTENGKQIEELNKHLDELKLKADMLNSEKEELGAKASALVVDVKCRDERISLMGEHMHQLHLEHAKLITEIGTAQRAGEELRARAKEMEEEVEQQRAVILDGAERKREAIRQLCFSLEHYRDGYHRLRRVMHGNKRAAVMAA